MLATKGFYKNIGPFLPNRLRRKGRVCRCFYKNKGYNLPNERYKNGT